MAYQPATRQPEHRGYAGWVRHKGEWHQVVYGDDREAVGRALKVKADRLGVPLADRWFLAAGEHPAARHTRMSPAAGPRGGVVYPRRAA